MTNSAKLIGPIITAALWASIAAGQGLQSRDSGEDMPPDLSLPSMDSTSPGGPAMQPSENESSPTAAAIQPGVPTDGYNPGDGCEPYQTDLHGLWGEVAPIESTGTWLRRGFWYAETDAVVFNRMWKRKDAAIRRPGSERNNWAKL